MKGLVMKSEISNKKERIAWISILQALSIAAIVVGHLDIDGDLNPEHPIANWIEDLMRFSLGAFFFMSGFLYVRSSQFNKPYWQLMKGKFQRLLIPYIFMTIVMFVIKASIPSMMSREIEWGGEYIGRMFLFPWDGPARHVWFLASLFTFFALTPLYKWTLSNDKMNSALITLALLFLLQQMSGELTKCAFFSIDRSSQYFVFFYLGMFVMKFNLIEFLQNRISLIICLLLYFAGTFIDIPLHVYWGIGLLLSLSFFISKWNPTLFSSFSKYSYQIYLMHFPPIMIARMLYVKQIIPLESLRFAICWIIALIMAIYLPVIVSKIVEKLPKPIRLLIGLE